MYYPSRYLEKVFQKKENFCVSLLREHISLFTFSSFISGQTYDVPHNNQKSHNRSLFMYDDICVQIYDEWRGVYGGCVCLNTRNKIYIFHFYLSPPDVLCSHEEEKKLFFIPLNHKICKFCVTFLCRCVCVCIYVWVCRLIIFYITRAHS